MQVAKTVLIVVLILISAMLTVLILSQEGKNAGLGSLGGQSVNSDSYWSRNKGRSREGLLVRATTFLVVVFFILAAVLNMGVFN